MNDIKGFDTFTKIEAVNKGLSSDKKYYIETADGRRLLLRIADISEYNRKNAAFEMMERVDALGVPMSRPVDFGVCDSGKSVYCLLTWCDGEDVESVLPMLPETDQYVLGVKVGEILRKIHSITAPDGLNAWYKRFFDVNDERLSSYRGCGIKFDGDEWIIDYIEQNKHLLKNRPQCFHHGDFHGGNIRVSHNHEPFIIDWDHADYGNFGDPWLEFNRIGSSVQTSPFFATGQINGYFNNDVPLEFWKVLALYLSMGAITAVPWATNYGQDMIDEIIELCKNVLVWFDNMQNPVPIWYSQKFNIQYIDDVPYK